MALLLSVIIPCCNDATALAAALRRLEPAGDDVEIILADASDGPECRSLAESCGAVVVECSRRGRGLQMNEGAAAAQGQVLVFSHADTLLGHEHLAALRQASATAPHWLAGAFYKDFAAHYPVFAAAEPLSRWWTREYGVLYGDHSLFFRREHFFALGGFPNIPIMEDVSMSRLMRRAGGLLFLDPPLRTSMRRFQRRGYWKNRLQNLAVVWLYQLGLWRAESIYQWYYGRKPE